MNGKQRNDIIYFRNFCRKIYNLNFNKFLKYLLCCSSSIPLCSLPLPLAIYSYIIALFFNFHAYIFAFKSSLIFKIKLKENNKNTGKLPKSDQVECIFVTHRIHAYTESRNIQSCISEYDCQQLVLFI